MCVVGDTRPQLVPELDVTDLGTSLRFYLEVCRFTVRYERVEERFVYLECGRADLMLQEAAGPGRRFRTAPLQPPLGRGINLQIEVDEDVARLEQRAVAAGHTVVLELEEAWYRTPTGLAGNRQIVLADPDGYLLRFFTDRGVRSP